MNFRLSKTPNLKTRHRGLVRPPASNLPRAALTLLILGVMLFSPLWAAAAQVTLAWDPSPDTDIAGYRIYARTDTEAYQQKWNGPETQGTLADLSPATNYFFVVRAVATTGVESPDSNAVAYQTAALPPPPVNAVPVAAAQSLSTDEDRALPITLSGADADGDALSFGLVGQPSRGTLNGVAPNLVYTPNADYFGTDSFAFRVNDGLADSNTATVTIAVRAVNDVPVASNRSLTTDEDTPAPVALAAVDVDSNTLTYTVLIPPANGQLTGSGALLTYTPGQDFSGSDQFTFRANDGAANSNTATVAISVKAVNDAPVATDGALVTDQGAPATVSLSAWDVDSTNLVYSIVDAPQNGTIAGGGATWAYTPAAGFSGSDRFTFKASDGTAESNLATVAIIVNAVNQPPVADAGPDQDADEGATVPLDGSNSSDPDGDGVVYEWVQTDGIPVQLLNPRDVSPEFTAPAVSIQGASLTFELTVGDAGGLESRDICIVNVSWENQPPVADAGLDCQVGEGDLVVLDGSHSSDPDDGIVSYSWKQTSGEKVALLDYTAMRLEFTAPDVDMTGAALGFELTVTDAGGLQSRDGCLVNVTWENQPPVADAGPDDQVGPGQSVALDGSASWDPDGGNVSYRWTQTSGVPVALSEPTAAQPVFTAPDVNTADAVSSAGADGTLLTFELTVTDAGGLQSSDTCRINVAAQTDTDSVVIQRLNYRYYWRTDYLYLTATSSRPGMPF